MSEPLTLFITSPTTGDTVPMCLRADYDALAAELAGARQLLGVYREQRDTAEAHIRELEAALHASKRLFDEALPKFDWGRSALDANAITLLNEVPPLVNAALADSLLIDGDKS